MRIFLEDKKAVTKTNAVLLIAMLVAGFVAGVAAGYYLYYRPEKAPIVVLTWGGPWEESIVTIGRKFTEKTGHPVFIELETSSFPEYQKMKAAWPNVDVDVFFSGEPALYAAAKDGLLAEITPDKIPNMKDIPETFWAPRIDGKIYGVSFEYWSNIVAWRSDIITTPITKYEDLYRPDLKGKLGLPSVTQEVGMAFATFALFAGGDEWNYQPGVEALKRLAATGNIGYVIEATEGVVRGLTTGDFPIMFTPGGYVAEVPKDIPISFCKIFEDGPTTLGSDNIGIIDGPQKEIAMEFLNFFLQADNYEYASKLYGYPGTSTAFQNDPEVMKYNLSPEEVKEHGHLLDLEACQANYSTWEQIWETEINPLIVQAKD